MNQSTCQWTAELFELPPFECSWAGRMAVLCVSQEQAHMLYGVGFVKQLCAVPLTQLSSPLSFLVLAARPAPPSRVKKPLLSLHPAAVWQGRGVQEEDCTAVTCWPLVPAVSHVYATCTVFCHAEEPFIIYCITAVEIYFPIRGEKKKTKLSRPVSFPRLWISLGWGWQKKKGKGSRTGLGAGSLWGCSSGRGTAVRGCFQNAGMAMLCFHSDGVSEKLPGC